MMDVGTPACLPNWGVFLTWSNIFDDDQKLSTAAPNALVSNAERKTACHLENCDTELGGAQEPPFAHVTLANNGSRTPLETLLHRVFQDEAHDFANLNWALPLF